MNKLAIFGAGASGREVAWLARDGWGDDLSLTFLVGAGACVIRDVAPGGMVVGVPAARTL